MQGKLIVYCGTILIFVAFTFATQSQALVDLYISTNGPSDWAMKWSWVPSGNPCSGYGIVCDLFGNVISIDLEGNGLRGTIPTSFTPANLPNLHTLYSG